MIEVIVFDLGGVVVNVNLDTPLGMLFDNSRRFNDNTKDKPALSRLMRKFETGSINTIEFHETVVDHLSLQLSIDDFQKVSNEAIEAGDNGINNIIQTLSRNFKLAILSNTNPVHFEYIKDKYSIIGMFDHILLSYEMGSVKPNIKAFEMLMDATSKLPSQHLLIDDRIENINAAKEIGMEGIQYKSIKSLIVALKAMEIRV